MSYAEQKGHMPHEDNMEDYNPEENSGDDRSTKSNTINLPNHEDLPPTFKEDIYSDSSASNGVQEQGLEAIYEVPVQVSAVLGNTSMQVSQLLKLGRGAVVELDRKVGDPVDIYVNDRLVARGEVVVVDEHLGVTLTEIIRKEQAA